MQKVLTAAQMREVDRLTTERYGIPSIILMENAAHATARVITEKLGGSVKGKSILILCGKGNNGGDGAALARILHMNGAVVIVDVFGSLSDAASDAKTNFEILSGLARATARGFFREQDIQDVDAFDDWLAATNFDFADVVVDALFGTGLNRELDGFLGNLTGWMGNWRRGNEKPYIVSIDLPSGLSSDTGQVLGANVHAHTTITFTTPKIGNVVAPASSFNGELIIADIGSPQVLIDEQVSQLYVATRADVSTWFNNSEFLDSSFKNKRGHALVIAGSSNYSGAAVLAGNAAMRSGVGLVTLACPTNAKTEIASRLLPEVILTTIELPDFDEHVSKADAVAVGCGLDANNAEVETLVRKIIETRTRPIIVDAGALWFYSPAEDSLQKPARSKGTDQPDSTARNPLILTPHEGEFLRLLGTDDKAAIKDRVAAVRDFATKQNVILVLKGERVLIGAPDGRVVVNPTGNSGLGKAGNGDTLTGILAGFVSQAAKMNIDFFETVVAAVYIAGMAGDIAEKKFGKRVMTASDVRECLVEVFDSLEVAD